MKPSKSFLTKQFIKFRSQFPSDVSGWNSSPIVVGDILDPNVQAVYNDMPSIRFYGQYPYHYYQQYPHHPEEPTFIAIKPRPKNKKKFKPNRTARPLARDSMKLTSARPKPEKLQKLSQMDIKLIQAVQKPDSKFEIERFYYVPGQDTEEFPAAQSAPIYVNLKSQKIKLHKQILREEELEEDHETATVKVESIGMSSADQPIPDYSAYFPRTEFKQSGKGIEATLILEPNAKAISGNDGTSISAPISRAILRKGMSVKVLFRPQSVAISGAGGTSHAQADLILDIIEDEE